MLRVVKFIKDREKLLKYVHKYLKVGYITQRLIYQISVFCLMLHYCACLWIIAAKIDFGLEPTWLDNFIELDNRHQYMFSFYWTVTTLTTVGYGDITGTTSLEIIFCIIVMLIGVLMFSFVRASLETMIW